MTLLHYYYNVRQNVDVDLTWLVGSIVAGVCYLVLARPHPSPRQAGPAQSTPETPGKAPDKVGA